VAARVQAAVPDPVRRAAVAFANYKMREYAGVFGPKNARVLVSAAGLLGLVPVPGALPLGLALLEGAYWSCRGARVVAGPGSKALPADTHERLALAAIAVLRDWYARNGQQAPAIPAEVARRAVAAALADDTDIGGAVDAAGAKALRGESWFRRGPRGPKSTVALVITDGTGAGDEGGGTTPGRQRIKPPTVPTSWLRSPRRAAAVVKALHRRTGHAKDLEVPDGDEVAEAL
jgi:hypothetical protein